MEFFCIVTAFVLVVYNMLSQQMKQNGDDKIEIRVPCFKKKVKKAEK